MTTETTKRWQIWCEGYLATGMEGIPAKAHLFGEVEAETFQEACDNFFTRSAEDKTLYHPSPPRYWGCGLFDNEADARKNFG